MSRFRDDSEPQSWTQKLTAGITTVSNDISEPQYRSITDELSPDYFRKKARGEFLPVNPMERTKNTYSMILGNHLWENTDPITGSVNALTRVNGSLSSAFAWVLGYANFNIPWGGASVPMPATAPLVTNALASARTAGFDAGTFAAEVHKTVDLIRHFRERVFTRASNIVHSRKGNIASRGMLGFSETWLEARYGWRQIFFDAEAINESLLRLQSLVGPYSRAHSRAEEVASHVLNSVPDIAITRNSPSTVLSVNNISRVSGSVTQQITQRAAGGVILQSVAHDLAFVDPLVTGWEVVPFSFIADWFFTIGKNIAAYSPFATGALLGAWTSETTELITSYDCTMLPSSTGNPRISGPRSSHSESVQVLYSRLTTTPSFGVTLDIRLSPEKLLDLGAIFVIKYFRLLRDIRNISRV